MVLLRNVMDALEEVDLETSCYYNKKTNEILYESSFGGTYTEEDNDNDDDAILMFDYRDKNDYDIMQDFICTIKDADLREKMFSHTNGRGAFRMFRCLLDENELADDWYKFRDNRYKEIAILWCEENNIEYREN